MAHPFLALLADFDVRPDDAVLLLGSHARGVAGPTSDVDLMLLTRSDDDTRRSRQRVAAGQLVSVAVVRPRETAAWFTEPEQICIMVGSLRAAQILRDAEGRLAVLLEEAHAFRWTAARRRAARQAAGQALAGWGEEVGKGLEGLRRGDTGRLLAAQHAALWGMPNVIKLHHGLLLASENELQAQTMAAMGVDSDWSRTLRRVIGAAEAVPLARRVRAGLALYELTAGHLLPAGAVSPPDAAIIRQALAHIDAGKA